MEECGIIPRTYARRS